MTDLNPALFQDFSGGITENENQKDPTKYVAADNFLITNDRKLASRPGLIAIDSTNYQLPSLDQPVADFINFDKDTALFGYSGQYLFELGDTWSELLGPTGNHAFTLADARSNIGF